MAKKERACGDTHAHSGEPKAALLRRIGASARMKIGTPLMVIAVSTVPVMGAQKPHLAGFADYTYSTPNTKRDNAAKFMEQRYDIRQVLYILDPDYRSRKVWAFVTLPETESSVALLLNVHTKYGSWDQIGFGKGISDKSFGKDNYGICYSVYDSKDRLIYSKEEMVGKLRPNETYKLVFDVEGNNHVSGMAVDQNGRVLSRQSLPTPAKVEDGTNYFIAPYSKHITGLMTETFSKRKYNSEGQAVYKFYPNPIASQTADGLPKYGLGVEIRNTVMVDDKRKDDVYAVLTKYYPENILSMGPYYQWVSPNETEGAYTFTTTADMKVTK